jgi:hypothetical protein
MLLLDSVTLHQLKFFQATAKLQNRRTAKLPSI